MDKEKKNRSGSQSNDGSTQMAKNIKGKTHQPGAPSKSNRQTGGNRRNERDDSNRGTKTNTTKKQGNSI